MSYRYLHYLLSSFYSAGYQQYVDNPDYYFEIWESADCISSELVNLSYSYPGVTIAFNAVKRTLFDNYINIISGQTESFAWLLIVQDDVVLAKNFFFYLEWILPRLPEDLGLLDFFTYPPDAIGWPYLLWPYPPELFGGAQCILLRGACSRDFLHSKAVRDHGEYKNVKYNPFVFEYDQGFYSHAHIDFCLGKYFKTESKYKIYGHNPSIVQHVGGVNSTIGNVGERQSDNFIGKEYDCLYMLSQKMEEWEKIMKCKKEIWINSNKGIFTQTV
ncbi:MAG: hypothetical protein C4527_04255 [Candidatus Omnitrophota bacterium]|nr:MAG: hypothetical protein C4527_04255 [Candidatus Omnitrophota bacterium]